MGRLDHARRKKEKEKKRIILRRNERSPSPDTHAHPQNINPTAKFSGERRRQPPPLQRRLYHRVGGSFLVFFLFFFLRSLPEKSVCSSLKSLTSRDPNVGAGELLYDSFDFVIDLLKAVSFYDGCRKKKKKKRPKWGWELRGWPERQDGRQASPWGSCVSAASTKQSGPTDLHKNS